MDKSSEQRGVVSRLGSGQPSSQLKMPKRITQQGFRFAVSLPARSFSNPSLVFLSWWVLLHLEPPHELKNVSVLEAS